MCEQLSDLREAMARYAGAFDPFVVADLPAVIATVAAIESMASTVKALAAVRAAELEGWKRSGHRSAADALAAQTGASIGAAAETIRTGGRLAGAEGLGAAARSGSLSFEQVRLIAAALAERPSAESALLALAEGASLAELREACAAAIAAAHPDPDERDRSAHRARRLRQYTDLHGRWHLSAQGRPADGALIMAAIASRREALFAEARRQGRHEPTEAYGFDALVGLCTGGPKKGSSSARAKIIVRVDLEALLRGYPTEGEACELIGYGPIPVGAITDMIDSGDPFLAAVATRGQALVGVAHLGRRPSAAQQSALEWLYPSCAAAGCCAQARLQNDHRIDWSRTHFTLLDLLDRLCAHHHRLKTTKHWALVPGRGKRAFVAPDDPRHPNHPSRARRGPEPHGPEGQRVRC